MTSEHLHPILGKHTIPQLLPRLIMLTKPDGIVVREETPGKNHGETVIEVEKATALPARPVDEGWM